MYIPVINTPKIINDIGLKNHSEPVWIFLCMRIARTARDVIATVSPAINVVEIFTLLRIGPLRQ